MGEFVIECYESGSISFSAAEAVILRDFPEWHLELVMAHELMSL